MTDAAGHEARLARSCVGSLILHRIDHEPAGCTMAEEHEGCAGIELRHEGDPLDCVTEWNGCNRCGIHLAEDR